MTPGPGGPILLPMARIHRKDMENAVVAALRGAGVPEEPALVCARIITESTMDGVASHGINKLPSLVDMIQQGLVHPGAAPERIAGSGATERWDGHSGLGIYNAWVCTHRACELAEEHGVGCVGVRNTNHWFRAGAYGLQAARAGYALMGWTNTTPNMPAWGAAGRRVGNNPLVVAAPTEDEPVVLDIAMSQVSMGKLHLSRARGEDLDVPGGYDASGALTTDPGAVLDGGRVLPMGFHKGSGLALLLDILAVLLSGGNATHELGAMEVEHDVSQVFVAFAAPAAAGAGVAEILAAFHDTEPLAGQRGLHPGQRSRESRERAEVEGCEVDDEVWREVTALAG